MINLLVFGLALWRISSLFVNESGPFHVFEKFRELIGIYYYDDGTTMAIPEKWLPKLFSCVWCLSMFLALFYVPLIYFFCDIVFWISFPFAISAIAILMEEKGHG